MPHRGGMSLTSSTSSRPAGTVRPRLKLLPVLLLMLAVLLGLLAVAAAYAIAREYADPAATPLHHGTQAMGDWWGAVAAVVALGVGVLLLSRDSRGRRSLQAAAVGTVIGTLVAVPAGAVLGAQHKLRDLPTTAGCGADSFGPGVAGIVQDAQRAFDELGHPGWLGGGSAGVHGCESMLRAQPGVDVATAYVDELRTNGWHVTAVDPGRVEAGRGDQGFTAFRRGGGSWTVWVGPSGSAP